MGRRKNGIPLSIERIPPRRAYRVTAVDGSPLALDLAEFNFVESVKTHFLKRDLMFSPSFELADMHDLSSVSGIYDGVWSCTALFTHTPRALVRTASLLCREHAEVEGSIRSRLSLRQRGNAIRQSSRVAHRMH